jgi:hypothetical protein
MRWKWIVLAVLVAIESPAAAQVQSRPTEPPLVTAVHDSWFVLGEPIQFAGELYAPAGPAVFFNGNTMVRSGHYNGVPLYTDTTIEPFSVVLVPMSRGLMQPYRRLAPLAPIVLMAPVAPTAPPLSPGAISVYTPDTPGTIATVGVRAPAVVDPQTNVPLTDIVGTTGVGVTRSHAGPPVVIMRRPENNDGVWIMFEGEKWISAGRAVPLVAADFVRVGEYAGFSVLTRRDFSEDVIYLPSRAGLIAPYRLRNPSRAR